jgi:hypothetical protein
MIPVANVTSRGTDGGTGLANSSNAPTVVAPKAPRHTTDNVLVPCTGTGTGTAIIIMLTNGRQLSSLSTQCRAKAGLRVP